MVIPHISQWYKSLVKETLESVILVGIKYEKESSNKNHHHGFVKVVLNKLNQYVTEVEQIEGPVYLL